MSRKRKKQRGGGWTPGLKKAIEGNWDRLETFVKLVGYVNCKDDFTDQPKVITLVLRYGL